METTSAKLRVLKKEEQPNPKTVFPNAHHEIVYEFTIGDENYFSFHDFNDVPCERGFHILTFYNEMQQKCTREYLLAFSTALENILNSPKIKITDIMTLNMQLKERLEFITEPMIALKLCTVYFFTENENPYMFNYKKSAEKAEAFKNCGDAFFLTISKKPIARLIPYISTLANDSSTFWEITNMMTEKHLETISTMLSEADKSKEFYKLLELQKPLDSTAKK
jgi:hypothetical protein